MNKTNLIFHPNRGEIVFSEIENREDYTDSEVCQAALDFCQESGNCTGLFIDVNVTLIKTITVHFGQSITSNGTAERTDNEKSTAGVKISVALTESNTDAFYCAEKSALNRLNGSGTVGQRFENLSIVVKKPCRAVINLGGGQHQIVRNVGIKAGLAQYGFCLGVKYWGGSATGGPLFLNMEHTKVDGSAVCAYYLDGNYTILKNVWSVRAGGVGFQLSGRRTIIQNLRVEASNEEGILSDCDVLDINGLYYENVGQTGVLAGIYLRSGQIATLSNGQYNQPSKKTPLPLLIDAIDRVVLTGNHRNFRYSTTVNTGFVTSVYNYNDKVSPDAQAPNIVQGITLDGTNTIDGAILKDVSIQEALYLSGLTLIGDRENYVLNSEELNLTIREDKRFTIKPNSTDTPTGDKASSFVVNASMINGSEVLTYLVDMEAIKSVADGFFTISFYAKATKKNKGNIAIQVGSSSSYAQTVESFQLTPNWQRYQNTYQGNLSHILVKSKSSMLIGDEIAIYGMQLNTGKQAKAVVKTTGTSVKDNRVILNVGELEINGNVSINGRVVNKK